MGLVWEHNTAFMLYQKLEKEYGGNYHVSDSILNKKEAYYNLLTDYLSRFLMISFAN